MITKMGELWSTMEKSSETNQAVRNEMDDMKKESESAARLSTDAAQYTRNVASSCEGQSEVIEEAAASSVYMAELTESLLKKAGKFKV
ncbi:hypothetical protein [Peribacillus kribbensis]|uniref:hypothetical protein n=1 Tax=Peribacillus kribbensis TaxID=356658 RepID=UPI0004236E80|nr:hypothetical protein [Peribacillus kribbensis]